MKTKVIPAVIAALFFAVGFSSASADSSEKLDFASYLEETLGHFHALELNLDDDNAELAIVHATHPIAELYDLMKPELQEHDPEFDARIQDTLTNLRSNTVDVTREDAQAALDEAREIIEEARMLIVGEELSNDPSFKMSLIKTLLETSIVEYAEAVENGAIHEMAEFQDGSAFVWKSQQIFDEIKADLPEHEVEEIDEFYADLWHAYDQRADPSTVETLASGVIHEIEEIAGEESDEKLAFAGYLEETLGHFWAIELNLDEQNAALALVHATHPIAELYDLMKPVLTEADAEFDAKVKQTLDALGEKTGSDVSREDAQSAIDEARDIIEEARMIVVGEELSNDSTFQLGLIKGLLETSAAECAEAVESGAIHEMAEFQDGSAFVWRSQQIFDEIKADLPEHEVEEIDEFYADLWDAYDKRADPTLVRTLVDGIIHEIEEIAGEESDDGGLHAYFENIEHLLAETSEEYAGGNTDLALSLATKAYLDNYEFLEGPISEHDDELMVEIEVMMREELRNMIKNGAPLDDIDSQIDTILEKLEDAEVLVLGSMEHEEEHEEENTYADLTPLKQVDVGIEPEDVVCASGMELLIKNSNGSPACVKPETAERLIQLGWGTRQ